MLERLKAFGGRRMSKSISDEPPSLWAEQWAIQASVEADRIQHQMEVAKAAERLDARREAAARAIEELLGSVRRATQQRRRWWRYRGPFDRWRGTSVERAYQSLHAARVFLVELLSDESVEALV